MRKDIFVLILGCIIAVSCQKRETATNPAPLNKNKLVPLNKECGDTTALYIEDDIPLIKTDVSKLEVINVPEDRPFLNPKEIVADYNYIPLETSDECLIGEITKIESDSDTLFIFDEINNAMFVFSDKGKFICKIGKKGRGPGEYIRLKDVGIDRYKKEICLLDNEGGKSLFYNYRGNFIRETPMYYNFTSIAFLKENLVLGTKIAHTYEALASNSLIISKRNQVPILKGFPYPEELIGNFNHIFSNSLFVYNEQIYYQTILSDTIWAIDETTRHAKYTFKFPYGKLYDKIKIKDLTNEKYEKLTEEKDHYTGDFLQTSNFACFCFVHNGLVIPLIYNRKNGHIRYGMYSAEADDSALGHIGFDQNVLRHVLHDSFVISLSPYYLLQNVKEMEDKGIHLKGKDLELIKHIKEEDNPVLMLVRLKDF